MAEVKPVDSVQHRTTELKDSLRKRFPHFLKAVLITAIVGLVLLVLWILLSGLLAVVPEFQDIFAVLVWMTIISVFITRLTEDTVYKDAFVVARALFLIFYLAFATRYGVLSISYEGYFVTAEFIPLLALMIAISVVDMARGVLQIIQFTSETPEG